MVKSNKGFNEQRQVKTFPYRSQFLSISAFIVGIWYFCMRILGYHLEFIPGDLGDSRFINYLLEHGHRWITGDIDNFWDAGFMYPFKNTIALSDTMLGTLPLYSVWRFLGVSPESAYQLWWICICSLNYWCSYFVFKKWFSRFDVAILLAWIFAFSVFNFGQLNYMQMIIRFMVPVAFYGAFKIIERPSVKYLFMYCFAIVLQLYSATYTGFYLLYFSALFIVIHYLTSKKWKTLNYYLEKKNAIYTSVILIFTLLALSNLLLPYYSMSKIVGLKLYREVIINLPLWSSFLFSHEASISWGFLFNYAKPDVSQWWLQYLFTGMIPFVTMIVSPFYMCYSKYKKIAIPPIVKSVIVTSVIITLLHIRTEGGLTLYALLFKLPGINSMRVLTRFMHVELFILLLIAGYALVKMKTNYLLLFIPLLFFDNCFEPARIQRQAKSELIQRRENLLTTLKKYDYKKYRAVALIDTTQPAFVTHLDMMLVSQQAGVNTVNGYSSSCPDAFGPFLKENTETGLHQWLQSNALRKEEVLVIRK